MPSPVPIAGAFDYKVPSSTGPGTFYPLDGFDFTTTLGAAILDAVTQQCYRAKNYDADLEFTFSGSSHWENSHPDPGDPVIIRNFTWNGSASLAYVMGTDAPTDENSFIMPVDRVDDVDGALRRIVRWISLGSFVIDSTAEWTDELTIDGVPPDGYPRTGTGTVSGTANLDWASSVDLPGSGYPCISGTYIYPALKFTFSITCSYPGDWDNLADGVPFPALAGCMISGDSFDSHSQSGSLSMVFDRTTFDIPIEFDATALNPDVTGSNDTGIAITTTERSHFNWTP